MLFFMRGGFEWDIVRHERHANKIYLAKFAILILNPKTTR